MYLLLKTIMALNVFIGYLQQKSVTHRSDRIQKTDFCALEKISSFNGWTLFIQNKGLPEKHEAQAQNELSCKSCRPPIRDRFGKGKAVLFRLFSLFYLGFGLHKLQNETTNS